MYIDEEYSFPTSAPDDLTNPANIAPPEQPNEPDMFALYSKEQLKPLSPLTYFGLSVLFAVPLLGLIALIVFSFDKQNINRRNYARSYWFIIVIVAVAMIITVITAGGSLAAIGKLF